MEDQTTDRDGGGSMKILQWFIGVGVGGVAMIALGMMLRLPYPSDGLVIGGSVIVGSAAISLAILATAKQ
jgi:hypothetical protein